MENENFRVQYFVIHKVLLKFTKILSHECLEPYGMLFDLLAVVAFGSTKMPTVDWVKI